MAIDPKQKWRNRIKFEAGHSDADTTELGRVYTFEAFKVKWPALDLLNDTVTRTHFITQGFILWGAFGILVYDEEKLSKEYRRLLVKNFGERDELKTVQDYIRDSMGAALSAFAGKPASASQIAQMKATIEQELRSFIDDGRIKRFEVSSHNSGLRFASDSIVVKVQLGASADYLQFKVDLG